MTKSFGALYAALESTPAYQAEKLAVAFLAELNGQMQDKGITNAELARRMGVSAAYISKIFRGPSNLSVETLAKLVDAIGCTVHLHLANTAVKVRWLDVFHDPRSYGRDSKAEKYDFSKTMSQLKPVYLQESNDEKFALAA